MLELGSKLTQCRKAYFVKWIDLSNFIINYLLHNSERWHKNKKYAINNYTACIPCVATRGEVNMTPQSPQFTDMSTILNKFAGYFWNRSWPVFNRGWLKNSRWLIFILWIKWSLLGRHFCLALLKQYAIFIEIASLISTVLLAIFRFLNLFPNQSKLFVLAAPCQTTYLVFRDLQGQTRTSRKLINIQ